MVRSTAVLRFALAAAAAGVAPLSSIDLAAQEPGVSASSRVQDDELYTVEELDNLLAPVALYPDPILAQLFIAATYPDQIQLAARYLEMYGAENLDEQAWDISVRAIAHYGPVLNMLAERPNWATAVGRAYALQSGDVMASVQNLRRLARAQGNLQSTDQQRVEVEREYIRIVPAQPRVVYVPVYDPYVVYYRPVNYFQVATPYWSFGVGYPIGAWLNYDLDWDTRVVYYHGWNGYGRRHTWYHVSRPYIAFNSIYVGSRYTHISINFGVRDRWVNYGGFGYYNTVHRNTGWDRRGLPGHRYGYGNGYRSGNGNYGSRDRAPQPDRYGIPSNGGGTYRPSKSSGGAVPRAGGSGGAGSAGGNDVSNGRPSRGGNAGPGRTDGNGNGGRGNGNAGRGNGGNGGNGVIADRPNGNSNGGTSGRVAPRASGSRMPVDEDRVKPVRIGGNTRPLYPRGEDVSSDRTRGGNSGNAGGNADRGQTRATSEGFGTPTTRGRDADPVRAPRATGAERISTASPSRSAPRYDAPRAERSTPRYESPRYDAPRSQPRAERSAPSSSPRVSAPRASESRGSSSGSAPRASAPRGGNSGSAPRASAPRGGGSGSAPRASSSRGGRDRG